MSQARKLLQLRLEPALYDELAQEVEQRKHEGKTASLTGVAIEWLEKGKRIAGKQKDSTHSGEVGHR
jgi:hypothetical protein